MSDRVRIDVWLKQVCLIKHRTQAAEACRGGKVKINGERVKPSAAVRPGDVVEFMQDTHYRRVVAETLPEGPVSREVARTLYRDETPKQDSDTLRVALRERGSGRPTKRDRREVDKFRR
ncbi:MAG: S4 domain-containing protein [Acidobacteriota bacterium]|nr:S4 domain-containing protein [Acidobacteriota bacterium]